MPVSPAMSISHESHRLLYSKRKAKKVNVRFAWMQSGRCCSRHLSRDIFFHHRAVHKESDEHHQTQRPDKTEHKSPGTHIPADLRHTAEYGRRHRQPSCQRHEKRDGADSRRSARIMIIRLQYPPSCPVHPCALQASASHPPRGTPRPAAGRGRCTSPDRGSFQAARMSRGTSDRRR